MLSIYENFNNSNSDTFEEEITFDDNTKFTILFRNRQTEINKNLNQRYDFLLAVKYPEDFKDLDELKANLIIKNHKFYTNEEEYEKQDQDLNEEYLLDEFKYKCIFNLDNLKDGAFKFSFDIMLRGQEYEINSDKFDKVFMIVAGIPPPIMIVDREELGVQFFFTKINNFYNTLFNIKY